ncbi:esterase lipase [Pyrenophora seminiperda CCB06]|uniref:Esterase lipase n=1 Tax=Pyrenophora seminiperda CCB06 TaxID=1302712 RepID=A0A3M7M0T0_9PLEO|nr:esterase lipase [Pyrenophora seminiperda CCB06]
MTDNNASNTTTKAGSSIQITYRHDRTLLMTVLQSLVRLMRTRISNRTADHEDGSIRLHPSKSSLCQCTLRERTVCDMHIYDVVPPNHAEKSSKKRIYYFAGGSWQEPPSPQHYKLCAKLAKEMPNTAISIVSTPLAPNNPAPSAFPWCMKTYRALMAEAEGAGEKVILAGDSSGANIALCLVLEALREDSEKEGTEIKQDSHPVAIMNVCPSADLTRTNTDIDKVAPRDPLLTPKIIRATAKAWCGDWDPADRRISPINADISLLARKGIKVHGITAGFDVLSPDGIIFRTKCAEAGVEGQWVHWEKQMHCFILTLPYGLAEAKDAVKWIIDVLNKE